MKNNTETRSKCWLGHPSKHTQKRWEIRFHKKGVSWQETDKLVCCWYFHGQSEKNTQLQQQHNVSQLATEKTGRKLSGPSHRWAQQLPLTPPTASRRRPGLPSVVTKGSRWETRMSDTARGGLSNRNSKYRKTMFAPKPLSWMLKRTEAPHVDV